MSFLATRAARVRTTVSRATMLPLFIRGGIALVFFGALTIAWPVSLVTGRVLVPLVLVALYPAFAPRGRAVTFAVLVAVAGWIYDTTWYEARVALWRVLAIATLTYLGHTLAALAAVLPYDAVFGALQAGWTKGFGADADHLVLDDVLQCRFGDEFLEFVLGHGGETSTPISCVALLYQAQGFLGVPLVHQQHRNSRVDRDHEIYAQRRRVVKRSGE